MPCTGHHGEEKKEEKKEPKDEEKKMLKDSKGNLALRDIVQFVPFREFNYSYKRYAEELLNELAE